MTDQDTRRKAREWAEYITAVSKLYGTFAPQARPAARFILDNTESTLPDPLFGARATHLNRGEGVVTSHFPVVDGTVRFMFPDEASNDGTAFQWVSLSTLTFHTPDMSKNAAKIDTSTAHVDPIDTTPDHPVFLETEDDYANTPEGTIVLVDALPGEGAWTKTAPGEWAGTPSFMVWCDRYMSAVPSRVIRWGREA